MACMMQRIETSDRLPFPPACDRTREGRGERSVTFRPRRPRSPANESGVVTGDVSNDVQWSGMRLVRLSKETSSTPPRRFLGSSPGDALPGAFVRLNVRHVLFFVGVSHCEEPLQPRSGGSGQSAQGLYGRRRLPPVHVRRCTLGIRLSSLVPGYWATTAFAHAVNATAPRADISALT